MNIQISISIPSQLSMNLPDNYYIVLEWVTQTNGSSYVRNYLHF